jgi:hypothetical protein
LGGLSQPLARLHELLRYLARHAGQPASHTADRLKRLRQHLRELIGALAGLAGLCGCLRCARLGQLLGLTGCGMSRRCHAGATAARTRGTACRRWHSGRRRGADPGGCLGRPCIA